MLLYDGLHYDALAVAAAEGAGPEADITIFQAGTPEAASILRSAEALVAQVGLPFLSCLLPGLHERVPNPFACWFGP